MDTLQTPPKDQVQPVQTVDFDGHIDACIRRVFSGKMIRGPHNGDKAGLILLGRNALMADGTYSGYRDGSYPAGIEKAPDEYILFPHLVRRRMIADAAHRVNTCFSEFKSDSTGIIPAEFLSNFLIYRRLICLELGKSLTISYLTQIE